jgi:DNA-binding response OmpR family regulator
VKPRPGKPGARDGGRSGAGTEPEPRVERAEPVKFADRVVSQRRIQLPELFEPDDNPADETALETPADERCVLLVTRSPALKNFLVPIFRREDCPAVVASTREEVALALSQYPVSHILVAQDLVEPFSAWISEGGLASAGAEVSVLNQVSTTLLDNPVPYTKMIRAVMATVQLLSDERAAQANGSAPYALIARDIAEMCGTFGLRRIASDGTQVAAWLLIPPVTGTAAPFRDLARSIATARTLNFPWRLDALLERMRSFYAGQTHPAASGANSAEVDIAAQILALAWYRHAVIPSGAVGPASEAEERNSRQRLRAVAGRLASIEVVEAYIRLLESSGQTVDAGKRQPVVVVTNNDDVARDLSASFGRLGLRVVHKRSMADARPYCEQLPPAAVIVDFAALGMEAARLSVVLRLIPGLLMYALVDAADPSVTLDLIDMGFDDVLPPPHDFGIIAARVTRSTRQAKRSSTRDTHTGFRGTFGALSFVDLLQSLAQSRKSVRVELSRGDGEAAMVHLDQGKLVHARAGEVLGVDAVYLVIAWGDDGTFMVVPIDAFPAPNITDPVEAVLMEGCRRFDESHALR